MCLYPKTILNKKYLPNKKNKYNPEKCTDERKRYITADCGYCWQCRKKKANDWKVRLNEEIRTNKDAYFVTLTFDDESYNKLKTKYKLKDENQIATKAIRLVLENIRKKTKKYARHWFITEKGHENTKRLHLHGIVWDKETTRTLCEKWTYGIKFVGTFVNERTMGYIVKYMNKEDTENKYFIGKVICSKGIGKNYIEREDAKNNIYKGEKTNTTYRYRNGSIMQLPKYYKNKIYTEEERDKLWTILLDKDEYYICNSKYKGKDHEERDRLLEMHREELEIQ